MTGVETINLTSMATGAVFDMDNVSGVENITSTGSGFTMTVDDIQTNVTSITVSNNSAAQTFTFKTAALSGTADALTLNLDGAAAIVNIGSEGDADGDHETITINAIGGNSDLGAGNGFGADATSVTITGSADLDLGTAASFAKVTSFDASAATGDVDVVIANRAAASETAVSFTMGSGADVLDMAALVAAQRGDTTVDMGAGNDTLDIGGVRDQDTGSSYDGGDGTDTLIISGSVLAAADKARLSNFEVLAIETTGLTQDADNFTGTTFETGAAIATMSVDDLANGSTINIKHAVATSLTASLKTDTAADTLTVNIGGTAGGITLAALIADTTYETITINSQGTAANTLTAISTNVIDNMVFTGSTGLTLSSADNVTGVLDFTAMTGDVTVTVTDTTAQTLSLGSGDDTVTSGVVASATQIINLGAGDDSFTAGAITTAGVLTINGEAGSDTITVAAMTGATTASSATIDGGAGVDFITLDTVAGNSVDVKSTATGVADADEITGFTTAVDDFDYNGTVLNESATTITAVSGTTLAAGLAADADATVYIVSTAFTGQTATDMAALVAESTAAGIATDYATFEATLALALGTITGLDATLSASETVLLNVDDGTNSVVLRVTNTDTSTANTLTAAELDLVAVMVAADDLVVGDFI
jgi:hypothetical protein